MDKGVGELIGGLIGAFLGFCVALTLFAFLHGRVVDCRLSHDLRQEAVDAGAATWTVDQQGNRGFEWVVAPS